MKRTIAILLTTAMLVLSAGCSGSGGQSASSSGASGADAPASEAAAAEIAFPLAEPETIRICCQKRTLHTTSFDEMPFVQMMEEQTNVHVEWTEYNESNWNEKVNLDFASGDLKDAYMTCYGMDDGTLMKYVGEGQIIPIDELIAQYGPHLTAKLEQYPQVRAASTALDGHIYGLARYENDGNDIPSFMYINQTWLDALGLDVPATTEDLTAVLRAFKEKDPNGNGVADEIPFCGIGDFTKQDYSFFNMFGMFGLATDINGLVVREGKVAFAAVQDGWKEACKYFAELYAEGLIDNETFTQGETQLTAKGSGEAERIGLLMGWNATNYVGSGYAADYVPIAYPQAEGYTRTMYRQSAPGVSFNNFWVTNKCENPALVIAWLDHMNSSDEMTVQASFGMIGEEYNLFYNDDGALEYWTGSPENMAFGEYRHKWSLATSAYIIHDVSEMSQNNIFLGNPNNMEKSGICRTFDEYAVAEAMPLSIKFTDEETATITNIKSSIMDQVLQMSARWIAGESDVDADWESYTNTLDGIGLQDYIAIYQTAYDRYMSN